MARLLRDARFAFRLFSKAPAFTSLAIVVLALLACLVPARRAASLDPIVALRQQ